MLVCFSLVSFGIAVSSPTGSRNTLSSHGIPWFLNLCYSYELHESLLERPTQGMKWYYPYGNHSDKLLLGTNSFPSLRLHDAGHLPKQLDGYNCGIGACAAIGIVLRNMLQKDEDKVPLFDTGFKRVKNQVFLKEETTGESYLMFPENFFQEILPTTDDLGFDDYLTTLREEWFVVFDRMAKLMYVTAPKRLNPDNQVDPMYVDILTKNTWPDYKRREVRSQYTKAQLRAEVERMARQRHQYVASHSVPSSQTSMQSHAVLPLVSQTPDTAKKRVTNQIRQSHGRTT